MEAYSGTLTNNDYAFVQTTDTAGNTLYDRYKWNGSEWLFEYELNNSSFTAAQWAAINSGATAQKLANYVTTNTAQNISAQKEFRGGIKINNTGSATYGILNQLSNGKIDWYCVGSDGNWSQNYIEMNPSYETVVRGATNVQLLGTTPATTNQSPTEDTTTSKQIDTVGARNTKINSVLQGLMPSGVILPFGGSSAPTGFLICDGSAVSRTDYANLFDVIGTTYGSGDGSTTFNLPNLSSGVLPSSSTVDVVGNGNALGIVDDISTEAKQHNALVVGQGSGFSNAKVPFSAFNLNAPLAIGSTSTGSQFGTNDKALGVSTLPEWSGLTGSITGVSVNYIIKV